MDPRELHLENNAEIEEPSSISDETPDQSQRSHESHQSSEAEVAAQSDIRVSSLSTGLCYDDRMKFHANADFTDSPHHPEDPRRIQAIMKEFVDADLVYKGSEHELAEILKKSPAKYMWRIAARRANPEEICLVHTASHFEWVRSLKDKSSRELREMTKTFDNGRKSLYVGNLTYYAALISAGGAIETCKNVVEGKVRNAIAVIRPPGHHAEHNESMGFCIFNNVPIAVRTCQRDYGNICRKVLILDWDVHHGNGIQNMFYNDPNVLYISLHVYQDGLFYPGQPEEEDLPDGGPNNVGAGMGVGKNVNIAWHDQGMGDGEYLAAFQRIVMPIATEFDPDLVVISAGFDAAAGDELGGCYVTPGCYSQMTFMLMSLAKGKVAVCLEGGYNLNAISHSALAVAKTLMGEPPERMEPPPLNAKAHKDLQHVKNYHAPYWACMRPGVVPIKELRVQNGVRISDVAREYQRSILSKKFNMIVMPIMRNKITKTFENQVLVTPGIQRARKILLIIHDPPEIVAQADTYDSSVNSHNAWMTDPLLPYIRWGIQNSYGIIDVNIPSHLTPSSTDRALTPKVEEQQIQLHSKELLAYLWDNYLQLNVGAPITILGVGDAYLGIKLLLTSREVKSRIPTILSFVTGSLRPVKSETDPSLSGWYKSHSLIFVSSNHSCWNDEENSKRVRKQRFGYVRKSEVGDVSGIGGNGSSALGSGLSVMLDRHLEEACRWIEVKGAEWESLWGEGSEAEEEGMGGAGEGMEDELLGVSSSRVPAGSMQGVLGQSAMTA
ncbi:histone deacetylase [Halenospora varia]|nr:histone deacetylase [Halenospora varia]